MTLNQNEIAALIEVAKAADYVLSQVIASGEFNNDEADEYGFAALEAALAPIDWTRFRTLIHTYDHPEESR